MDSMLFYPFSISYTIHTKYTVKLCCPPVDNRTPTDPYCICYMIAGELLELYCYIQLKCIQRKPTIQRCSKGERWLIVES